MKKNIYPCIISIMLIFIAWSFGTFQAKAQNSKSMNSKRVFDEYWYGGLNGGKSNYIGDLNTNDLWSSHFDIGAGAILGYQISPVLGVRFQYLNGKLSTNNKNEFTKSLESKYWDCGYQITLNIIELITKYNPDRPLNIYVFAGPSLVSYHSVIYNSNESQYRETDGRYNEMLYILGGGISIKILKPLDLNLEYAHHFSMVDDRMDFNDALKKNDKFSYASVGLTYKLLERDKDKDGVIDKKDLCPEIPGAIELAGCPDKDSDGIADKDDACMDVAGKPEFRGCPDTDNDGIADKDDQCPAMAGTKELNGCPDKDGDAVADKDDRCLDVAGLKVLLGCPDKDNDGIADLDDRCPDIKGLQQFKGCPDKDADGTPDIDDKCPDVAGPVSNNGCPEAKKYELYKVVYFDSGKTSVVSKYTIDLNEISEILKQHPEANIIIEGYADALGSDKLNLKLSEKRTDYIYNFFLSKGIDKTRLVKKFYGEENPVADNNTIEGRQLNRRVVIQTIK